jgi:16S rRNA (cytidine1402-2'-O)-methyltransferase
VTPEPCSLVLVPTPIGNLGDITLRAIDTLRSAEHIVAEDTRHSRKLLAHLGIEGSKLSRLDANATDPDVQAVIDWAAAGQQVAVITDAGTPAVSDPGAALVRAALQRGVLVTALPGASAVTVAVAASGLVDSAFRFLGFGSRSIQDRASMAASIAASPDPCVLFESPNRVEALLGELAEAMPARPVVVCRELTKLHEEFIRGTLAEVVSQPREWIGEVTIVLGPWEPAQADAPGDEQIDQRIDEQLAQGGHTRTVAERVAAWSGRPKREIYARVLERKDRAR